MVYETQVSLHGRIRSVASFSCKYLARADHRVQSKQPRAIPLSFVRTVCAFVSG